LILKPDTKLEIQMFVHADSAGLHGYEEPEHPTSVRNRTSRYVICIAKCPVTSVNKLQFESAMSAIHAKYTALSSGIRDLNHSSKFLKKCAGIGGY
jgi:hypothetical protein